MLAAVVTSTHPLPHPLLEECLYIPNVKLVQLPWKQEIWQVCIQG